MCGIFSYISKENFLNDDEIELSRTKTKELFHRGPDHYGEWFSENIFFGIQRLSINDLSKNGNQPLIYKDKVLIFNGEIYNHLKYKKILQEKGYKFQSKCDTEVIFYFLIEFGITKLEKLNGMYSFIYFDGKSVHFGNDIFSEKTLFYFKDKDKIIISSELNNLKSFSDKNNDKEIIYSYFSFGHLIGDKTFYKNIFKLRPGQIITIEKNLNLKSYKFFDPKKFYLNNKETNKNSRFSTNIFFDEIENSLKLRFKADRKMGMLFSGGLDSSIVADRYVETETKDLSMAIYSNNKEKFIEENEITKKINKILFIDNTDFKRDNKSILDLFGQPIDSFTSLAIKNLCKELSQNNVNCALSGLGADELFFGYNKFFDHQEIKFKLNKILNIGFRSLNLSLISKISKKNEIFYFIKNQDYLNWMNDVFSFNKNYSLIENIFFNDIEYFLPNSRCLTNDVASMSHAVELRGSFLDIDLLKLILSYDLNKLSILGKKKILIDFHKNKTKNFNNYNKYPFWIRPDKKDNTEEKNLDYINLFFKNITKKKLTESINDRGDMLNTFFS